MSNTEDPKNPKSEEEVAGFVDLKQAFSVFDKNNDGFISAKELGTAMRAFGYNPSAIELQNLMKLYDTDDSGTIDMYEFMELMTNKMKEQVEEKELIEMFETFDRNGDGLLSRDELKYVFSIIKEDINDNLLDAFINEADLDKDGYINCEEFIKVMLGK